MRKSSPEALLAITTIILLTVIPILVGWVLVKVYRVFRPFPKQELSGLASIGVQEKDSFFKFVLVGWIVCGPIYYWAYSSGVLG